MVVGTEITGDGWGRERLSFTLRCHQQSDSCIKTGADESPTVLDIGSGLPPNRLSCFDYLVFRPFYRHRVAVACVLTMTHKENEKHERFRHLVFVWCQKRDSEQ